MTLFDYHIIQVDSVYDARPTESGIIPFTTSAIRTEKELDRFSRKLLQGIIHATPGAYTDKQYMPLDPGFPNYKLFVGHDAIQERVNKGYAWNREKFYNPSEREKYDYLTIADYGAMIDAQKGEVVYFHPEVTEKENFLGMNGDKFMYKAAVDQIICSGTPVRAQGGYVLVSPHMETEEDLKSEHGLIIKTDVEARLLEGTVVNCRNGAPVKIGESILFQENANWEIMIDGVMYYAMKEDEIWMCRETH